MLESVSGGGGVEPVDQMKGAKTRGEAPSRSGQNNPSRTQISPNVEIVARHVAG